LRQFSVNIPYEGRTTVLPHEPTSSYECSRKFL